MPETYPNFSVAYIQERTLKQNEVLTAKHVSNDTVEHGREPLSLLTAGNAGWDSGSRQYISFSLYIHW